MKSIVIEGATPEELSEGISNFLAGNTIEVDASLMVDASLENSKLIPAPKSIIHCEAYTSQIMTPNQFNPQQPKIELSYKLLIIYNE